MTVRRHAARCLLMGVLAMTASSLISLQPAQTQEEDLPATEEAPPGDEPPGDPGSGEPPPEVVEDVNAAVEAVAEPVAAAEEQTAEQQFIIAVLLKLADLKNRYGNAAAAGQIVPFSVLDAIDSELTAFLRPYAQQLCDQTLVLTGDLAGISEEIRERMRFKAWYILVPPALIGWLFFRKSICVNRLLEQVLAAGSPLNACAVANGHYELRWSSIRPQLFGSQSEAVNDSYRYLHETGQLPMSQAEWATRWQTIQQPPANWFCLHD